MIAIPGLLVLLALGQTEVDLVRAPEMVYAFAKQLESEGDYFAAISEYKRYMYLVGGESDSVLYRIGNIYTNVERYGNALDVIYRVKVRDDRYQFELGRVYFLAGDYGKARDSWQPLHRDTLVGLTLLREKNFREAGELLGAIGAPRRKSPFVAGIFSSVIPGSGRVYAGRTGDGLFSFFLTVGSGLVAYRYYSSDRNLPAAGFGLLSLFLYLGDIYGAANSCIIHSEKEEERFVEEVESAIGLERLLQNQETME